MPCQSFIDVPKGALKEEMMRIVVDAMGSDQYPEPDVAGAVLAAKEYGDTVILVGDQKVIEKELIKHETQGLKLEVIHAEQVITMEDKPSQVGKAKPRSSMHIGMGLVKDGLAEGFVTAGNSGAALAIAILSTLKRIPGVKRPAMGQVVRIGGQSVVLLDIGANADCKPDWMAQFALMGKIYSQNALKLSNPRIGLLSNGEEEGKGNEAIRETALLLQQMPLNFVGNIEPKEIFQNKADIVVSDGFVGNILIKTMEGTSSLLVNLIRDELKSNVFSMVGGMLSRPAFRRVRKQIDPFEIGGALLLGVNGVVIIGHGRSNAKAVKNAVRQAREAAQGGIVSAIREGLQEISALSRATE
jgi:phosphate acyltransferase